MPQPFITEAVVRTVSALPGFPRLAVLDLSCGEGEVLSRLSTAGCTVEGTHYREGDYIIKTRARLAHLRITDGVDLQQPLPFGNASFDVVLLTEVLEHLPHHFGILPEVARVLRPGGHLVFSTPNIFRLHSRLQFFLTGKHKLIRRRIGWDVGREELYAYHISPVDFPLLHTLLHQANLGLLRLDFTRWKWKSLLFAPLWPLIWLACRLTVDKDARRESVFRAGEEDLNRWLSSPALLFSEQLLGLAQRRSDGTSAPQR